MTTTSNTTAAAKRETLKQLAHTWGAEFYDGYRGRRAASGAQCVGIVCTRSNCNAIADAAVHAGLRFYRIDSMGLDLILYWPNVPATDD